jgi:predicted RNA binding protein YcfA (HicA-like mRNA interferase family)
LIGHCTNFCATEIDDAQTFVHPGSGLSKKKKLRAKLMEKNRTVSFAEAEQLLLGASFIHDLGEGSHRVYRHPDGRKMVLAYHGKDVKPAYIKQIRKLLS